MKPDACFNYGSQQVDPVVEGREFGHAKVSMVPRRGSAKIQVNAVVKPVDRVERTPLLIGAGRIEILAHSWSQPLTANATARPSLWPAFRSRAEKN